MEDKVKAVSTVSCPHCQKEIIVMLEVKPPVIKSVLNTEVISNAKEQLKGYVLSQGFDKNFVKEVVEWIEAETTIFGVDEVDELLLNIQDSYNDYDSTKSDHTK